MRRAPGSSGLAVALALPLAPALPGHALTGPSTARGLSGSVRFIGLDALEGAPFVKNRPGDAGELVGERNRQHVVVEALLGGLDPRLEPVAVPMLWPDLDQHDPGGLHARTECANSDCRALICCRGSCGRRSIAVSARARAMRRSRGLSRTHRRCRSRPPSRSR